MQEHIHDLVQRAHDIKMDTKDAGSLFTNFYRNMFGLHGWAVTVEFPENAEVFGSCWYNYRLRQAKVKYEENQTLRSMEMTAAHEMLHLAMAGVENVFQRAVESLPLKTQEVLYKLFVDECEAFVAVTSDAVVNLRRGEYSGEKPNCSFCNSSRLGLTPHQED